MKLLFVFPEVLVAGLGLAFVAVQYARHPNDKRTDYLLVVCLFATAATLLVERTIHLISSIRTLRYDLFLYAIDGSLGFSPSVTIARLRDAEWLRLISDLDYNAMPAAVVILFWAYLYRVGISDAVSMLKTILVNIVCGVPIYFLIPASGPRYAFPTFPDVPPFKPEIIHLTNPTNCVPSVHFATALLILWFARRWKIGIVVGSLHVALTGIATLGSGEHYAVDLALAIPYAWLIHRACIRHSPSVEESETAVATAATNL